jgi:MFS family permease
VTSPADDASPAAGTLARWQVLVVHMAAVALLQGTANAVQGLLAVIAKKEFGAGNLEVVLITSAPTVFFVLSIFWGGLYARRRLGSFLVLYWLICCLPLAFVGLASNVWMLIGLQIVSCIGVAGYHPPAGDLLKSLYPDAIRGRIYSFVWGAWMISGALFGFGIGQWLKVDAHAFAMYMPIAAAVQLVGVGLMVWLSRASGHAARREASIDRSAWSISQAFEPVTHMREVLKADPVFARYEAAYMTYGVGWMIVYALLPIYVLKRLDLTYDQIANSTQVAYLIALVLAAVPAGWLMDRIGAIRNCAISFAMLALYPIALIFTASEYQLMLASVWFGLAHAGASVGWMLGPVSMAPTPAKVAQYVGIHATLVGVRGAIFQAAGVGLYELTQSFTWPLLIAALAYVWSAWQMWSLHKSRNSPQKRAD